jgi:NADH-quinone oxidoreductase subunit G
VPGAFTPSPDEWLIVPLHHIFGSEELSARAPSVASLAPQPYLALGDEDARRLFGEGGGFVRLDWGGYRARLPVRRLSGLPRGIAGVPVGLAALPGLQPPFKARIVPEGMGHA